jgi:competence CoiA-like predicted nuclease
MSIISGGNHFSPAKKIFTFTKRGRESHIYFTTATTFHMWNLILYTSKMQQPLNIKVKFRRTSCYIRLTTGVDSKNINMIVRDKFKNSF